MRHWMIALVVLGALGLAAAVPASACPDEIYVSAPARTYYSTGYSYPSTYYYPSGYTYRTYPSYSYYYPYNTYYSSSYYPSYYNTGVTLPRPPLPYFNVGMR